MSLSRTVRHARAILTGFKYLLAGPRLTIMYPDEIQELPEGYRGMIEYDWDSCTKCSLCAMVCPADAMKMYVSKEESEKEGKVVKRPGINYTRCIFCGFCVDICPTDSLRFTKIHDVAYYTYDEQIYPPAEFSKGVPKPFYFKEPRRVRVVLDERRGIKYEPTSRY
ncbi:MAG: NADH-quinone oxidoreductase subunit I [Candidatus Korarchaeum sp.]|nr:NADH-quinone oxidoreductase subunit I [Candidatus Korarchaeum sp.]MDW8034943.1 NADH-quinone oxidoreductase subunit I [Candidatus Korarchaeum sp.]